MVIADIPFCAVAKKSTECDDDDDTSSGWKSTSKEENATGIEKGSINDSVYDDSEQHNKSSDDTCAAFNGEEIMTNQENRQLTTYPTDVKEKLGIQLAISTLQNTVKHSTDSDKESETVDGKKNRSTRVTDVGVSHVKDEKNVRYLGQGAIENTLDFETTPSANVTKLGEGTDVKINIEEISELNSDGVGSCNSGHDIVNSQNIRADSQNECKTCANGSESKQIDENSDILFIQSTDENPSQLQYCSTMSENKSSISQNEDTADEEYDSAAENESEHSESEVNLPVNGVANVPKTSQYRGRQKRKQKKKRKNKKKQKMAAEAKKKQKVHLKDKSTSNEKVDSEANRVFGTAKTEKDEINESNKRSSRPNIFSTKESDSIKDKPTDTNKVDLIIELCVKINIKTMGRNFDLLFILPLSDFNY